MLHKPLRSKQIALNSPMPYSLYYVSQFCYVINLSCTSAGKEIGVFQVPGYPKALKRGPQEPPSAFKSVSKNPLKDQKITYELKLCPNHLEPPLEEVPKTVDGFKIWNPTLNSLNPPLPCNLLFKSCKIFFMYRFDQPSCLHCAAPTVYIQTDICTHYCADISLPLYIKVQHNATVQYCHKKY